MSKKSNIMTVKVDSNGRVVIPYWMRNVFRIKKGDWITLEFVAKVKNNGEQEESS